MTFARGASNRSGMSLRNVEGISHKSFVFLFSVSISYDGAIFSPMTLYTGFFLDLCYECNFEMKGDQMPTCSPINVPVRFPVSCV